jgi:hypothetical protein
MNRLTLLLAIICGLLLAVVAYLSVTVVQQQEEISCNGRPSHANADCS